jgi:antitoxin (DNA-binding transcriptional repressor) of toxin-antitoxin stability system
VSLMRISLPHDASFEQGALEPRTVNSLRRAGLLDNPDLLRSQTVGTLMAVRFFGPRQLIDLALNLKNEHTPQPVPPSSLEQELSQLLARVRSGRDMEIAAAVWGWDGKGSKTLTATASQFGLTKERVRQVCGEMRQRIDQRFAAGLPELPLLTRAVGLIAGAAPGPVEAIEEKLVRAGIVAERFQLDGLLHAAATLGQHPAFELRPGPEGGLIVPQPDEVAAAERPPEEKVPDQPPATPPLPVEKPRFLNGSPRRPPPGRPSGYRWHSPAGVFEINFVREPHQGPDWCLYIDSHPLRHYEDPVDAMVAVFNQQTGHLPWDLYSGAVEKPSDDRDWEEC